MRTIGGIVATVVVAVGVGIVMTPGLTATPDPLAALTERVAELESKVKVLEVRVNALAERLGSARESTLQPSTNSASAAGNVGMGARQKIPTVSKNVVKRAPMAHLRFSYIRIDGQWHKLPEFDLRKPSSQDRPFTPSGRYYYRSPDATTGYSVSFSKPLKPPSALAIRETSGPIRNTLSVPRKSTTPWKYKGYRDVTDEVNRDKQKEWEEKIPSYRVGEFGLIPDWARVEVRQVLEKGALLVAIDDDILMYLDGFSTEGLTDGKAIKLSAIAIIGTKTYTTILGGSNTVLYAVPLSIIRRGLSEKELEALAQHLKMNE